jgi:hypothetical protein
VSSHLCRAYIDDNASAKRAHKAAVNKAQRKAKAAQRVAPVLPGVAPLPPPPSLARSVLQAQFFAQHTSFLRHYEAAVQPFRIMDEDDGGGRSSYYYGSDGEDDGNDPWDYFDDSCVFMPFAFYQSRFRFSGGGGGGSSSGDAEAYDSPPVAVPNKSLTALEMRDDRWQKAMADAGRRPGFVKARDRAMREWLSARGLHAPNQLAHSSVHGLPESLRDLARSLL